MGSDVRILLEFYYYKLTDDNTIEDSKPEMIRHSGPSILVSNKKRLD